VSPLLPLHARGAQTNTTHRPQMEELDGWHPVFGKTVYGFDVLRAISAEGTDNGLPKV
jgi:cyclophilin family peptidyl-prolyl cis-trans isomerase